MGKYSDLKLDKVPPIKDERRSRIDDMKASIQEKFRNDSIKLASFYTKTRKEIDEIKADQAAKQIVLDAISELVIDAFEFQGVTSLKLDTGESVRMEVIPYPYVEDREKFRLWCIEEGLEKEMVLHFKTMESMVKEKLLEGEPEPPGIKAYLNSRLKFVRAK
jgi:hypothetical protein